MNLFKQPRSLSTLTVFALFATGMPLVMAQEKSVVSILPNGDFQADENSDGTPDGWGPAKGGISYEKEGDNCYLHLVSKKSGQMVLNYKLIPIPAGIKALELTWKQRITDLKVGKSPWFDARIMLEFRDADLKKVAGTPPAPNARKATDGWVEKSAKFLVPEGAKSLAFMPALFQVVSGTYDLDDIVLKETDEAPIAEAAKARAEAYAEKLAKTTEKKQAAAAASIGPDGDLIANGDFQLDANADEIPDKWTKLKENMSWQKEGDNRFLSLVSPEAGKMVLFYRAIDLPKDTKALELKWKERVSNFKRGKESYFDARIMLEWKDAAGKKMAGSPSAPTVRKDTDGWVEKNKSFLVPEGALTLVMMPCLFQVETGTFDLDNLSLKPIDATEMLKAAETKTAGENTDQKAG